MKATKDFIIHIPQPYSETIKTEIGVEIYADKRFSADRLSNRVGTVIAAPINGEFEIKKGYQVLIDPTILYEQSYKATCGRQESVFLVDKQKSWYKIDPSMIVLFQENESINWKGFQNNAIYELIKEPNPQDEPLENSFLYIPETLLPKYKQDRAVLLYGNDEILKEVAPGQEVVVKPEMAIEYWIDGKTYKWFRNEDVVAVVN